VVSPGASSIIAAQHVAQQPADGYTILSAEQGGLVFNTALFYMNIDNYQQQVRVVDEYTTNLNIQNGVTPATAYVWPRSA